MLIHEHLRRCAANHPDKTALIVDGRHYSFREIDLSSDALAADLQERGVQRGDRVAVMLENSAEMVIALWASLKAGGVFVPINHTVKVDKLAFIIADSGAKCLLAPTSLQNQVLNAAARAPEPPAILWSDGQAPRTDEAVRRRLERFRAPRLIDQDLCLIIYTSGSTGYPKGVMLTHANVDSNIGSICSYLRNTADDVVLGVLPLSFNYGLLQVLTGVRAGFAVLLERSFAYPYETLKRIAQHRVTGLPGVPTVFAILLQYAPFDGLDLSSLRYITNTGAALAPAHLRRLRQILPQIPIYSMYGLTECQRVSFLDPARLDAKITSVGRSIPNSEAYIVDARGRRCVPGEVGELVIRGSGVMRGYWRRPEETAKALRDGDIPGEKVLYTGDLFCMDEDGDLYFVGRRDDVFKCKGEKISPIEIENVLYELDDVAEAAVIGLPDDIDGLAIKAYVVPCAGRQLTERALRRHCASRLEPWMMPKFIEICPTLPKSDTGKISKGSLRAITGMAN